ncbi:hypothetical protein R5R35_003347 [Gryllus longicercus]|uniref:Glucosylceramidase n=1 Tax=Gryllus longicercus TaxID=2509291 RepID=A0AAN9V707_9ORTH
MDWTSKLFAGLLLVIALSTARAANPCALREVSSDHLVCVCNATYCDTLDADTEVPSGQYVLFTTTKAGLRFAKSSGSLTPQAKAADVAFTLDPSSTQQTIIGYGGSFTDAAGINILSLSAPAQENFLRSYFSPEGIELNMGRVPIAGADFSTRPYTYDDVADDDDLSEFKLQPEDFQYKIPIIKRAMEMSRKSIKLLSAAWTSPTWMKTNNDFVGFSRLKEKYYQAWADYHVKFLNAYKEQALDFWAISTGNEPSNGIIPIMRFNSLGWSPASQSKWVAENLGPAIRNSPFNQTKILGLDDQRFMLPWWMTKMFENKDTYNYIDGIAVHWYWDNLLPPYLLTATHNNFPDKFILSTEACKGDRPWNYPKVALGSWSRSEDYMADIIQDMNHWVSGWVDWNLGLDMQGGPNWANNFVDAAVIVNKDADEFYKQPIFYAMGHFTKFVPEGSVHFTVEPSSKKGISTTAFTTPSGQSVVVLYNRRSSDKKVTVTHPEKGSVSITIPKNSYNTLLL